MDVTVYLWMLHTQCHHLASTKLRSAASFVTLYFVLLHTVCHHPPGTTIASEAIIFFLFFILFYFFIIAHRVPPPSWNENSVTCSQVTHSQKALSSSNFLQQKQKATKSNKKQQKATKSNNKKQQNLKNKKQQNLKKCSLQ
jgi:Ca2+/Na+ antiporter